jgi:hypothetical protein
MSRSFRRPQANQLGEQRIEALPVTRMKVDPADLLHQPLKGLRFLEPQQERVLFHQAGGVQQRARCRGLFLPAD